ncbi:MAG: YfiR family protein, partial [Bacteroidota bacterium]
VKIFLLLAAFVCNSFSSGSEGNEYQIKAMFIFNFTKYVEWPETKDAGDFTIGVIGESEILEPLERIATQKKVGNKKIIVKKLSLDDEDYCNIVIISKSRLNKLELVEKKYAGKGVLVISDESSRPAAINLVTRDNKVRFEITQSLAKSGGVKISSQLLALAVTVH